MDTTRKATARRRLLRLAEFLKTVPENRFNMNHFVGNNWKGDPNLSCGTSACAAGWATTMPFFRRLGLFIDSSDLVVRLKTKDGKILDVDTSLEKTFCIDRDGVTRVFYNSCGTPVEESQTIRDYVKDYLS